LQFVTGEWLHMTEQPLPESVSVVHATPSLQLAGHAPGLPAGIAVSHVSGASTEPLPQVDEQSVSEFALQPGGQQPSPELQPVTAE
jgi:hypothetical protein